jgi:toxin CcdB
MKSVYDPEAAKKATNLTVNSDLLAKAKELKINVSATLETALSEAVRKKAQYFAYENPNKQSRKVFPYILDIQSNLLEDLETVTVLPLTKFHAINKKFTKLTPLVEVNGIKHLAMTQQIVGIDRSLLGKPIDDLSMYRFAIVDAVDFIISGI